MQVQKRLVDLLAGECTPSEEIKIRTHLAGCSRCCRELEELQAVDSLLDSLPDEQEPPGLFGEIMSSFENLAVSPGSQLKIPAAGFFRDVAAAAAVALIAAWLGSGWFGGMASTADNRITGAVFSYLHLTGVAVSQAHSSASAINSGLFSTVDRISLPKNITHGSD
ncbi:MAG: anti-sigma factor [Desulfocucumaceae bacterium]